MEYFEKARAIGEEIMRSSEADKQAIVNQVTAIIRFTVLGEEEEKSCCCKRSVKNS